MKIASVPQKKFGKYQWLVLVLLVVILVPFSISGYVLYQLLHPDKVPIQTTPDQFQLSYQKIHFLSSKEKVPLKGWLIPAKSSKNIVIFAHGYGDNRSTIKATLPVANAIHKQGIATLLFDFRASGESEGDITTLGMNEKYDLNAAIAFAQSKGYEKIGLMGFSMGAATAIDTATESSNVKAVIADSSFSDLKSYLQDNLPIWSGLPSFFTPIILSISDFIGLDAGEIRPIQSIKKISNIPVFLIHTKKDPSIPSSESVKLAKAYQGVESILWLTSGSKHVGSYEANSNEYLLRVVSFFEKNLK
jgi:dipeptidyl aminopeptidase/acylaminoacyl peptidase